MSKRKLTLITNYASIKYMKKIQTWLSDLSDWFYNLVHLNTLGNVSNHTQEYILEHEDSIETLQDQMVNIYQRVSTLERVEMNRQLQSIIRLIDENTSSLKKTKRSKKTTKTSKRK